MESQLSNLVSKINYQCVPNCHNKLKKTIENTFNIEAGTHMKITKLRIL